MPGVKIEFHFMETDLPTQPAKMDATELNAPPAVAPATPYEKAAWIFVAVALYFILHFKLLPALLAGLFVYSLIHVLARRFEGKTFSRGRAKIVAVSLIALTIAGAVTALTFLLIAFVKGRLGDLPALLDKMAAIVESAREKLGGGDWLPQSDDLKNRIAHGLREHAQELQAVGGEVGRTALHALIGIVIGALIAFENRSANGPLSAALSERIHRVRDAFERVVFAQVRISALNSILTAAYLLVALPLCGIELPLRKTMVVVTFIVGLIPVLGNLISNTIIVIISLGVSLSVAVTSLIFLVVIHKLEYFINARIVGENINASAWEILIAMLLFESAFGIPGVIIAPIVYAYIKRELMDRRMI
jgi:predicted PurR-regulated permease PerM